MPYLGNQHIVGDSVHNFKVLDDISSYTETFDGSASSVVSTSAETIRISNHRFVNGQRVTYNNGGGSNIGGLSSGTAYYVIYDSAHTIKLATSAAHAASLTAINISAVGGGTSHTLNAAFDGVNKKFRITHGNGTHSRFSQASQLRIAINNVIQKANNDHNNFSEGYAIEVRNIIVFQTAPTVNDIFFGSLLGETLGTFDISDHKIDNHTADGSSVDYNLSRSVPNVESLLVSLNGVLQHPSDTSTTRSYSLPVDNIIRFTTPPALGVEIQIRHLGFAGASTGEVSGFYGRTGNVGLTTNDHITTGDITSRNINASGIITASSFIGDGSGLIGVASTDNIVTGTAATFNTYPVDINAGMTVAGVSTFAGNIDANGDLDVDGHTNLDNVNIAGVTTIAAGGKLAIGNVVPSKMLELNSGGVVASMHESTSGGYVEAQFKNSSRHYILGLRPDQSSAFCLLDNTSGSGGVLLKARGHKVTIDHDLDVDGHTNLDNVSVAGVSTFSDTVKVGTGVTIETNGQATFVGVVTFGSGSTTIDNNVVNVGTALTLGHTQGLQFHTQNLHSAGFEINQINASGIITASSLDIGGNVSIGGTLTYEDVTNIDSVGIVTAAAGDFDDFVSVGSNIHLGNAGVVTATTFSGSGANLTSLPAAQLSGTAAAINGSNITNLNASAIASGTVPTARLGSGTANSSTFLRGDSTFAAVTSTTISNNADDRLITGTGTANTINAEAELTFDGTSLKLTDHKNMYFGTGNDLRIWHDANNSYSQIAGGQKNLYIDGLTTYMRSGDGGGSGVENAIVMNNNGSVDLYHSGTKKFETTSSGNKLLGAQQDLHGDVKFDNQTNSGMDLRWDESQNRLHFEQDNIKAVFGASSDLEIYHSGAVNLIKGANSKNIYIQADDVALLNEAGNQTSIWCNSGAAVQLYYANSERLSTTSTGVTIAGTGALKFPIGTTAQRPSASQGMVRYNSTTNQLEVYDGSSWKNVNSQPFEASGGSESTSSRSGYKVHTFTSPGTFTVSGDVTTKTVEVLAIGGGGAGGEGGGGAGALRFSNSYPVSPGNYSVSIGGGGSGSQAHGNNGSSSSFGNFTAPGGGGGGGHSRSNGNPGGSGGGNRRDNGGSRGNASGASGGSNNSNSPSSGWGNRGGSGNVGNWCGGGGGGGAGGVGGQGNGGSSNGERGGPGGSGLAYSINGSSTTRAGGGGGGCEGSGNPSAPGRATSVNGGGGRGGVSNQVPGSFGASAGSSNTGGGGGGNASTGYSGGNHSGGSGIVIVAYTV